MTQLEQRNKLRMEIWDLNHDLRRMLEVPAEFRNADRIRAIETEIIQRESEIIAIMQAEV